MRCIETYVSVRPFLAHEVDACNRLGVPVESAVLVATAEGDVDEAFTTGAFQNLGEPCRGAGRAAAVDIRDKTARLSKNFTNCYWGVHPNMLPGPPVASTSTIAKEIAHPALEEFLSGRDVCIAAVGARVTGKTHLLFGDPSEPTHQGDSILSVFADGLWEAFGGEECIGLGNEVSVSALELLPDGNALNILEECRLAPNGLSDTFTGPIPGWNPLWDIVLKMYENLGIARSGNGIARGTTVLSLRVDRSGTQNKDTSPVAMFVEVEPFTNSTTTTVVSALRKLSADIFNSTSPPTAAALPSPSSASIDFNSPDLPWGVKLLGEALQGRAWSSRIIACVSPSPTALQASQCTMSVVSQFCSSPAVTTEAATPYRDVAGVLAFTPEAASDLNSPSNSGEPQPRAPPQPTPSRAPQHPQREMSHEMLRNISTSSEASTAPVVVATPKTNTVDESVCNELIGLVRILKSEVETLRTELAEERKRYHDASHEKDQCMRLHEQSTAKLKAENETLDKQLREKQLQLDMMSADKRSMERELRLKEEQRESLLYETQGLHRQLAANSSPQRYVRKSKSPTFQRATTPRVARNSYSRQPTNGSIRSTVSTRSNSAAAREQPKVRSHTPPSRVAPTASPTVAPVAHPVRARRGSITGGAPRVSVSSIHGVGKAPKQAAPFPVDSNPAKPTPNGTGNATVGRARSGTLLRGSGNYTTL